MSQKDNKDSKDVRGPPSPTPSLRAIISDYYKGKLPQVLPRPVPDDDWLSVPSKTLSSPSPAPLPGKSTDSKSDGKTDAKSDPDLSQLALFARAELLRLRSGRPAGSGERKVNYYCVQNLTWNGGPVNFNLCQIDQGTEFTQRLGNKINIHHILIKIIHWIPSTPATAVNSGSLNPPEFTHMAWVDQSQHC